MKAEDYIKIGIVAANIGARPDTKVVFVNRSDRVRSAYKTREIDEKSFEYAYEETELRHYRSGEIDFYIGYLEICNELCVRVI